MKTIKKLTVIVLLFCPSLLFSQLTPDELRNPFRRAYNHLLTYDVIVKYICQDLLQVEHNHLVDVTLGTVTSAKSGELTTAVYHSDQMRKQGFVMTFWSDQLTAEMTNRYDGYGFRTFDLTNASTILTRLSEIIEDKKVVLGEDNHAVFQYEDVTFVFRDRNTIFVCWGGYSSTWTVTNLKTTINRVSRFLKKKNG